MVRWKRIALAAPKIPILSEFRGSERRQTNRLSLSFSLSLSRGRARAETRDTKWVLCKPPRTTSPFFPRGARVKRKISGARFSKLRVSISTPPRACRIPRPIPPAAWREREREFESNKTRDIYTYIYIYTRVFLCARERERERERESERARRRVRRVLAFSRGARRQNQRQLAQRQLARARRWPARRVFKPRRRRFDPLLLHFLSKPLSVLRERRKTQNLRGPRFFEGADAFSDTSSSSEPRITSASSPATNLGLPFSGITSRTKLENLSIHVRWHSPARDPCPIFEFPSEKRIYISSATLRGSRRRAGHRPQTERCAALGPHGGRKGEPQSLSFSCLLLFPLYAKPTAAMPRVEGRYRPDRPHRPNRT